MIGPLSIFNAFTWLSSEHRVALNLLSTVVSQGRLMMTPFMENTPHLDKIVLLPEEAFHSAPQFIEKRENLSIFMIFIFS